MNDELKSQESLGLIRRLGRWVVRRYYGKLTITDGPFSETKEVVGGYWMIDAADYDEAIELSRDCPHIEYGASLEVREVEQV